MRVTRNAILALALIAGGLPPATRERPRPAGTAPQRIVASFTADDPRVPKSVRAALADAAQSGSPPQLPAVLQNRAIPLPVPASQVRSFVPDRARGGHWLATAAGLVYCPPSSAERCGYFAGRRYLPDDDVLAVHLDPSGATWARTQTGIARIEIRPMSREQKAAHFERITQQRHDRYGLIGSSQLTRPGDLSSNRMYPNDNDGLWSAIYIAAESFRFAATRSTEARRYAQDSMRALLRLEEITGIPGFPARAYIRKGDYRPAGGEWHSTADGKFEWKGDTSSDELVGHFFAFAVYSDLLVRGPDKAAIASTAARISDHILSHGRYLVGPSGKPTTWGKWAPEYFADKTTLGWCDAPLNALELLSFLKTTHHLTGNPKYDAEYRKLVDEGYPRLAAERLKRRCELNYSDEELAMLSFFPLLEYERDPRLRAIYLDALEQWWENMPRQRNPLWTYIYNRGIGKKVLLSEAEWTLDRYPLDLITWTVQNSHRADVTKAPEEDRFGKPQIVELLPPDERPVMRWNANPFRVDGGNDGREEEDGGAWLLAYWLGRHYGYTR